MAFYAAKVSSYRRRHVTVLAVSVALIGFLAWYLAARNVSAFDAQPSGPKVAYRVIVSASLTVPCLLLAVSAYRAQDWSRVGWRLGVLLAWCFAVLTLSFMLGV